MIRPVMSAVIMLIFAARTAPAGEPEPAYGGKTLSAWSEALNRKDATKPDRRDAAWGLYMIGPKAVPALVEALGSNEDQVRGDASLVLYLLGAHAVPALAKALKSPNETVRSRAQQLLEQLRPADDGAVPSLIEMLDDPKTQVQYLATQVLSKIGPKAEKAIPALLKVLRRAGPVHKNAAYTLGELGPKAVPALAEALADFEKKVRLAAAHGLCSVGPKASAAVPALARALADPETEVRHMAAGVLGKIGPAAKNAVPALIAALEDDKRNTPDSSMGVLRVRDAAADALGYIGPGAEEAVPALVKAQSKSRWSPDGSWDLDKTLREAAANALAKLAHSLAGKDVRTVPELVLALKSHPKPETRQAAAFELRKFAYNPVEPFRSSAPGKAEEHFWKLDDWGKADRARARRVPDKLPSAIIPALIEALGDKNPTVRKEAVEALTVIGVEAKAAVPGLIKLIDERAGEERAAAVVALWAVGADAKATLPLFEDAARDSDAAVRWAAAVALARIDPSGKRALVLAEAVRPGEVFGKNVADFASGELTALGPHAKDAVPTLVGSLADAYDLPSNPIPWTLIRLGEHAVPGLVEGFKGPQTQVRHGAAWVLGRMGPKAKDAVAPLAAALKDEELSVRVTAAKALLQIDPDASRKLGLH